MKGSILKQLLNLNTNINNDDMNNPFLLLLPPHFDIDFD